MSHRWCEREARHGPQSRDAIERYLPRTFIASISGQFKWSNRDFKRLPLLDEALIALQIVHPLPYQFHFIHLSLYCLRLMLVRSCANGLTDAEWVENVAVSWEGFT